jgi:hypothetical protein
MVTRWCFPEGGIGGLARYDFLFLYALSHPLPAGLPDAAAARLG